MSEDKVLIIEDNPELAVRNKALLEGADFSVVIQGDLQGAKSWLKENEPDLIILDVELPDGSGMDFCRRIRRSWNGPILFVSGHGELTIEGLQAGGDDFVRKPFSPEELLARAQALVTRTRRLREEAGRELAAGDLILNITSSRAFWTGTDLGLKPKEFLLLAELVRTNGEPISPDDLYQIVWGKDALSDNRTVHVHISTLRTKLRQAGAAQEPLVKIPGVGYAFRAAGWEENKI